MRHVNLCKICCFSITKSIYENIVVKTSTLCTMFFLNIELHIQNQNWGFIIGDIIDFILLNSLSLSWDNILDFKNI